MGAKQKRQIARLRRTVEQAGPDVVRLLARRLDQAELRVDQQRRKIEIIEAERRACWAEVQAADALDKPGMVALTIHMPARELARMNEAAFEQIGKDLAHRLHREGLGLVATRERELRRR